jgi:hypothetical protein
MCELFILRLNGIGVMPQQGWYQGRTGLAVFASRAAVHAI